MISIEFDLSNWIDTLEKVRDRMPAVISRALNRAGDQVATVVGRDLASETGLGVREVRDEMSISLPGLAPIPRIPQQIRPNLGLENCETAIKFSLPPPPASCKPTARRLMKNSPNDSLDFSGILPSNQSLVAFRHREMRLPRARPPRRG
jgi:Prophage minor tail protein Z (GPZ)